MNKTPLRLMILVAMCFIVVTSCRKKLDEVANYDLAIPREKMVSILTDIYLAEAALIEYSTEKQDSMRKLFITEIFTIQKTDKALFDSTLVLLGKNALLYNDIHNEILDSLHEGSADNK